MTESIDMDERLLDEALAWHRALDADGDGTGDPDGDGNAADWVGFTAWLEADPRHRTAFDEIALSDRIVDDHKDLLRDIMPGAVEYAPERQAPRRWLVGAMAAILAGAVGLPLALRPAADVTYESGRHMRHVALAGGIAVDLAPGSTLVATGGDANRLALKRGEAYFDVAHDPARTLAIDAGGYAISDIGTVFGVNLAGQTVLVNVARGKVAVDPAGTSPAVTVSAGQQLVGAQRGGATAVTAVSAGAVGSWRRGQLIYSDAPLAIVSGDISRYLGTPIALDPAIADRRFSGVLKVGDGSELLPTLADVMALSFRMEGNRIRVSAAPVR